MKVNIGSYKDYFSPYRIANTVFFWVRDVDQYDPLELDFTRWDYRLRDKFGDWLSDRVWFVKFLNWIDSKRQRKIQVRIDPWDTWSMDHTLALIIHPMLVQLKQMNHGYFSSDPEDAPSIGQGDVTDYGGNDTRALDRYNWIMDEMIWTFDELKSDRDHELFYNEETGQYNFEGQKEHDERMQNGLRLFGKYFRALWD